MIQPGTGPMLGKCPVAASAPALGMTISVPVGMPMLPRNITTNTPAYPKWMTSWWKYALRCPMNSALPVRRGRVARPQDRRGPAAAFIANRFEEIDRFDFAIAGLLAGQRDDLPDARRQADAFPDAAFASTKRPLNLGMNTSER